MAHELDFSLQKKGGFVAYRQPAWHGMGHVLPDRLTFDEVLTLSGLDFCVVKAPNRHLLTDMYGNVTVEKQSASSFFTLRTDTNAVLGDRMGKDYHVLQNHQALSIAEDLVSESSGSLRYETAGSLKGGRLVWVLLAFDEPIVIGQQDMINKYLLIASSHDGNMSLQARLTPVRVVCNNTLQSSQMKSGHCISIRHTSSAGTRLSEAARLLAEVGQSAENMEQAYTQLRSKYIGLDGFNGYLADLFLSVEEKKLLSSGQDIDKVLSSKKRNALTKVFDYALDGVGQDMAGPGSAWWAYNAITGYYANAKPYKDAGHRMQSMVFDAAATTMSHALSLAVKMPERPKVDETLTRSLTELISN